MVTAEREEVVVTLELRGGNREVFAERAPEMLVEGMAGTGKTRTILELLNLLCHRFAGMRALIVRKHQVTLTTTCLVTFNEKVLHPLDGVKFFGGNKSVPSAYQYPNGSVIVVGGMDNPDKILSSEYDLIYANEATELTLEDWEKLTTRLRNGVLPNPRIIGDCNPAHEAHWLNRRCKDGKTQRIRTSLEDNPAYYDVRGELTAQGQAYLNTLDRLTGSRYERFRLGIWAGYENAVYETFNRDTHVVELTPDIRFDLACGGADYGRVHKSAAVVVSRDQYKRLWVREAWGRPSEDKGEELRRVIARMRDRYSAYRWRFDPNQDVLSGSISGTVGKTAEGSRQHRIDLVMRRMGLFPGGRVPNLNEELFMNPTLRVPHGPFAEPDSPGILFVKGGAGIDALCDEIEGYHYEHVQTDRKDEMVVARINDDLVAALEYACEEADEGQQLDMTAARPVLTRLG